MKRLLAVALLPFWAAPVAAQQMDSSMPGMNMPAPNPPPKSPPAPSPSPASQGNMAGMAMAPAANPPDAGIPQTPPPPPPLDHLADRFYDPAAMAAARRDMRMEMGGGTVSKVMLNLAEYQAGSGGGGYRWDGQATFGGDMDRLVLRSEGEGSVKDGLETAEMQALYSRAVTTYFDLQAGVRQDFAPRGRTYVTVGTQGLFPYWFNVEAAVFLSTKGEFLARVEETYDFRLTQRVVLQPRAELNFAAQDTPQTRTGSGLSDAELGLRLRYEIRRELAPYIGVSYDRRVGRTADYVQAAGEDPGSVNFVVGLRSWF